MDNLPRGRVMPACPFLRTGVDYTGPIFTRTSKERGQQAHNAFIVVFICLCFREVYFNVVLDYSSEAFLATFRRFISRRGLCKETYLDCGTNFIGADEDWLLLRRSCENCFAHPLPTAVASHNTNIFSERAYHGISIHQPHSTLKDSGRRR